MDEKYLFNVKKGETLHIVDQDGTYDQDLDPGIPEETLLKMYRMMVLTRTYDEKAIKLQRAGRMGTYPPCSGQEATQAGSVFALKKDDWLVPSYRDICSMITLGISMKDLFLVWMGDDNGNRIPEGINSLPINIVVGSQLLHATGFAWAANIKKENIAVLTYVGDGGTSRGDFHTSLNFAGVFNVPAVYIIENNGFAISTRNKQETHAETLAQKALSYGIRGCRVDGMDVIAVYVAAKEALDRARKKEGPTLIESLCYRFGPHTTSDNPDLYRTKEELEKIMSKTDPVVRFKNYLIKKGIWDDKKESSLQEEAGDLVNKAAKEAEETPPPKFEELFENVFGNMPDYLQDEIDHYRKVSGGE
ncbi:pyruvate dehydrogenase (acetyl-transferring) E1 component subunit alpha [Methanocella sp. CWC-04]|uniref:Pyruvate dehydrogenase (Acetyl-transferring) E1 component subunit alpha n=1 Tax=Methanooceanicella nereidis TaxID=2052831 RepID=A0AAP2RCU7_9EURY|nr:pyruvate dehydrogenase (acetyl-transferring) E1 component subunit alpha [Methanocella sp. CWC-04]MCD1295189.1 pyruvate dehydrogenase (acetyl-transferring) E1 component subunit alpha [Methanocella sp. CWC-04]